MPDELDKKPNNTLPIIIIIALIMIILKAYMYNVFDVKPTTTDFIEHKQNEINEKVETSNNIPENNYSALKTLTINPFQEYNYLSKSAIYDIRKKYVASSVFASKNYKPNEEVFGQIETGKPWWGLKNYACRRENLTNIYGVSQMSRFINNPAMLIAPMMPYGLSIRDERKHFCNSEYSNFMPYELLYDKANNHITAKYKLHREIVANPTTFGPNGDPFSMIMIGLNAKDFGYKYIKIVNLKNIQMLHTPNASQHVYTLLDFVHVGGSCGVKGGCNNISPYQYETEFNVKDLPAVIEIKLWKNEPSGFETTADFTYSIIYEETYE